MLLRMPSSRSSSPSLTAEGCNDEEEEEGGGAIGGPRRSDRRSN